MRIKIPKIKYTCKLKSSKTREKNTPTAVILTTQRTAITKVFVRDLRLLSSEVRLYSFETRCLKMWRLTEHKPYRVG